MLVSFTDAGRGWFIRLCVLLLLWAVFVDCLDVACGLSFVGIWVVCFVWCGWFDCCYLFCLWFGLLLVWCGFDLVCYFGLRWFACF